MRKTILLTGILAVFLSVQAAQPVLFKWSAVNADGAQKQGFEPVTPDKAVMLEKSPASKWGVSLYVEAMRTVPWAIYRMRADFRTEKPVPFNFRCLQLNGGKWLSDGSTGKGVMTFFLVTEAKENSRWQIAFPRAAGKIEVKELSLEKLSPEEFYRNMLPDDGLQPGFWTGAWGNPKGCFPVRKKDASSPSGEVLSFAQTQPGDGNRASYMLPFWAKHDFELIFWIRSKKRKPLDFRIAGTSVNSQLTVKEQWTEYKFKSAAPEKFPRTGMWMMFSAGENSDFELGCVSFRYLPPKNDAQEVPPAAEDLSLSIAEKPVPGWEPVEKHREFWTSKFDSDRRRARKLGKKCKLAFFGDSITHFMLDRKNAPVWNCFREYDPVNFGYSGDRTQHTLWVVEKSGIFRDIQPQVAVILIGVNNYGGRQKSSPDETARGIRLIVDAIRKNSPATKIVLFAVFPRGEKAGNEYRRINDEVNRIIAAYADGKHVFFENINARFLQKDGTLPKSLFPDFLHPNVEGYRFWVEAIDPYLKKFAK